MEPIFDQSTSISFEPDLTPEFFQQFDRVIDRIVQYPERAESILSQRIDRIENKLGNDPNNEIVRYLAVLEVLLDLIEVGYGVGKNDPNSDANIVVYPPDVDRFSESPDLYKDYERRALEKEQKAQFKERSIREFIRKMETPIRHKGKQISIEDLVANGPSLYNDLIEARRSNQQETANVLRSTVKPYLQIVEPGEKDEHTGYDLHHIWRYFRYTWLTPYNTVPGRSMNFLIRDAARENHPVMGIASLASSMMNLGERDKFIGWTVDALQNRLKQRTREVTHEEQLPKEKRDYEGETRTVSRVEELETKEEWNERIEELCSRMRPAIKNGIINTIENIRYDDFIEYSDILTESHFENPTEETFKELRKIEGMARYVFQGEPDLESKNTKFDPDYYGLSKEDLVDIPWEDTDPDELDSWKAKSETALFVRKRSENLQTLLRDRVYLNEHENLSDREFIETAFDSNRGEQVISTGLREVKKRRVGAGMMNIQVCGAIPPYNEILGGKLVAMTLTGPEPINHYRSKYDGYTSKIASAMRGEPIKKPNELVLLDTTSLFASGSAQYDRIRVPAPSGQIEFQKVGQTLGYGSVHFGAMTRSRLAAVTKSAEGKQMVRSRFGEGIAPRMRKIRRGLENLEVDTQILKHESPRIVFIAPLATNASAYLRGETDDPNYYWSFDDVATEQEMIYDHWRKRWVSKRIQKDYIMDRIKEFDAREDLLLGPQIDYDQQQITDYT